MKCLVTGARGFVGRAVCEALRLQGHDLVGASANSGGISGGSALTLFRLIVRTERSEADLLGALKGVEVVIHLAARVHQMKDRAADPMAEFRRINGEGTRRLATLAAAAGVKRFVFVSSIKVNGESTAPGEVFRETDAPAPQDFYGCSKWEAECALREVEKSTGLEVVIFRPPLMYGAGVKANFQSLVRAVQRGRPLPLGCLTENRRSLLHVRNLADAIAIAVDHPQAAGQTFLVSDGEQISTAELVRRIATAAGRKPRLVPVPAAILRLVAKFAGKGAAVERLAGSLVIDDGCIRCTLGWSPPYAMADGLRETVAGLKEHP